MDAYSLVAIVLALVALGLMFFSIFVGVSAIKDIGGVFGKAIRLGYSGVFFVILLIGFFWLNIFTDIFGAISSVQVMIVSEVFLIIASSFWALCAIELSEPGKLAKGKKG